MDDLSILGNAALVPIVLAFTQMLKKARPVWNSDIVAVVVSVSLCMGFNIYNLTDNIIFTTLGTFKFIVDAGISGVGTAFAAAKSYDLLYGDKKLAEHKEKLEEKIQTLEAKSLEVPDEETLEQIKINASLRKILGD